MLSSDIQAKDYNNTHAGNQLVSFWYMNFQNQLHLLITEEAELKI